MPKRDGVVVPEPRGRYDLAIAYRIYPKISKPALGLPFSDDKFHLSEICLRSFKESLGDLKVKVWALLDGCPEVYSDLFRRYFNADDLILITLDGVGNRATFAKQIDLLIGQEDSEFVYFAEDDYFYLPDQFPAMLDFMKNCGEADFVSPYDHLDCYNLDLHHKPKWIRTYGDRHWRTAESTCLTFLTTKQTLARCESVFRSYVRGNDDCALWLSLTKQRIFNPLAFTRYLLRGQFYWKILLKAWLYCPRQVLLGSKWQLWVPIPGIATHLDAKSLSPAIDWVKLMREKSCPTNELTCTVGANGESAWA